MGWLAILPLMSQRAMSIAPMADSRDGSVLLVEVVPDAADVLRVLADHARLEHVDQDLRVMLRPGEKGVAGDAGVSLDADD